LIPQIDEPLSNFAFDFNLRTYNVETAQVVERWTPQLPHVNHLMPSSGAALAVHGHMLAFAVGTDG
jgi:hypothetical protein